MKVCFTSSGPDLNSDVDPRFGRARYFIIYDEESEEFEALDNEQNLNAASGAGIQSSTQAVNVGVKWVVTGHIGPKAMAVLKQAGVRVCIDADGTVAEAIEAFKAGKLQETDSADVEGHW